MKIKKLFLLAFLPLCFNSANAYELFNKDEAVQNGLNVFNVSSVFSDIYKKLDTVNWGGKDVNVAIESLEKINEKSHIAATDERVVLVWKDDIVANYPRPESGDWDGFGQITTALVLRLRELDPSFANLSENEMYQTVVDALMRGVDENGRYIFSKKAEIKEDGRILTSVGLECVKDERGNFRVNGIYKDSPADNAGIKSGDLISRINGTDVKSMESSSFESALSGFNSGTLKLTILTPSGEKPVVLRRATIVLADTDIVYKQINNDENNGILEIVVHKISDNTVSIVNEALAKHSGVTGIVLDLRATTGDDERAAAKLAGLFIGQKPVMRIVETLKNESEVIPGGDAVVHVPTVVLMSNTTTGTAEAVAAAFYENKIGVLVGTPTAGHAKIATTIDLYNGGALVLLNKSIKTGLGNIIDGRGVFPLVCLSNIRNTQQQGAFFLNIINDNFKYQDFNNNKDIPIDKIRKGCPSITSGADEDAVSAAVSTKILTDKKVYNKLLGE